MVKDLSVELCGIRLQNPVIPASGTFGFGLELAGSFDLNVLGAISLKGTTLEPRYGNPTPRVAECTEGMINSVGLQNPGIDVLVTEKVPALRKVYSQPVIANISGFSLDEYRECCRKADACEGIDIIEVNISYDYFYACGPKPMLKEVCESVRGRGEVSLEERMGCGAGFCYCCSIQTVNGPRRVCKDGPVFKKEELVW